MEEDCLRFYINEESVDLGRGTGMQGDMSKREKGLLQ